ncbi:MAG: hypothetical protein KC501_34405 [Myxococcales bacterium]|nr:hypothetical protein [Myxococcales bacterium]
MSPSPTIPEGLQALSRELREVEWLGHPEARPARPAMGSAVVDLALVVGGAIAGAALALLV